MNKASLEAFRSPRRRRCTGIPALGTDVRQVWRGAVILVVLLLLTGAAVASPDTFAPENEPELDGAFDRDGSVRGTGTSPARFSQEATESAFLVQMAGHATAGRSLVDIEVRWDGTQERYTAVWFPVPGVVHTLIQGTPTEWVDFVGQMEPLYGRWLDFEVGYFGGDKRYSGIYYQDGDAYGARMRTTNTDAEFQAHLDTFLREGRSIVDFEAYTEPGGATRFAGAWVSDPNQPPTHLIYNLAPAELAELLDPMQGRVIDIERYHSDLHGDDRYGVILAMLPGGDYGVYRGHTWATIVALDESISDGDTHLIDIDPVILSGGLLRFNAVWGPGYKSLNEIDVMPAVIDPEPLTPELSDLVTEFETTLGHGTVGLYAKNLRTDQSISYRRDEPFYLASCTKTAIHIKFWQHVAAGLFSANDLLAYTSADDTGSPWYVDERPYPGFATGPPGYSNDMGREFALSRYDRAMMTQSDNAACSALVLDPDIGVAYADNDLTEWMASEPGIGRGWGIVTSIQDVDRHVAWQSQQVAGHGGETSYFLLPRYALGPRFRHQFSVCVAPGIPLPECDELPCTRCWVHEDCIAGEWCEEHEDPWGEVADLFGLAPGEESPRVSFGNDGFPRYYATGLNSATPRAVGNLWEGFVEHRFLPSNWTATATQLMKTSSSLQNDDDFPAGVGMLAKGGAKHRICAETGVFRYGDQNQEQIVVSVTTKDLNIDCYDDDPDPDVTDDYMPLFGKELLFALGSDLDVVDRAADSVIVPAEVRPGETLAFLATVTNKTGGDADPVNVRFYLSTNGVLDNWDTLIDERRTGTIDGFDSEMLVGSSPTPTLPPGTYFYGWKLDADDELTELDEANIGFNPVPIQVLASLVEIPDLGFNNKTHIAWTATEDTASYRLHQGTSSTLPRLLDGELDSCRADIVTEPLARDVDAIPSPGELFWYLVQAESDGPFMPSSVGARSVDSIGECGASCAHAKCETGAALEPLCDPCVAMICQADNYCRDTQWDGLCIEQVRTVCSNLSCDTSAGACVHTACAEGAALVAGCDDPPVSPSCVTEICSHDLFCCDSAWDSLCVEHVADYCGANCE